VIRQTALRQKRDKDIAIPMHTQDKPCNQVHKQPSEMKKQSSHIA
jgi:hypothetical protein